MSTNDDNPLSRWSRLKRKRARGEAVEEAPDPGQGAASPVAGRPYLPPLADPDPSDPRTALIAPDGDSAEQDSDQRELTAEEAAFVETLPPLDDLGPESDFSGFMDKRVPDFLRRQALRKLWLSDPAFSLIDGMHEYGEDYSMMAQLAAGATAYRPDQGGYAWREKPKPEEETADAEQEGADSLSAAVPEGEDETVAGKARRVQDRGGSDVMQPTYTANPYYQAPGYRNPAPERLPDPRQARASDDAAADEDGLGDAEDDLG